jgi:citronellol/citronellal dehydrogenase
MANAAHAIVTSEAASTTGKFYIDDEVVASVEGPDLSKYRVTKDIKEIELLTDFLV